ncbi:unannotated protein [freshwater metagenome]|uniref:Unannotated protein n=1 Tax=freshwater metagenome TaxID=449393 RepID=A0A6J6IUF2_9ZZZZ
MRYGLTELTSATGKFSDNSRAKVRQSSKFPFTCKIFEPWATACASFPSAIFPLGIRTAGTIPALTAYAAADAEVFPVDAQITALDPSSAAFEIAIVMPRSLNDPVGFKPSYLIHTLFFNNSER